jgi:hypothetical protein
MPQAMCGAGVAAGPVTAARQIVAAAGWRGLFRGNGELVDSTACTACGWRCLVRTSASVHMSAASLDAEQSHCSCAATNVLRSAPQKALDFFAFDVLKVRLLGLRWVSHTCATPDSLQCCSATRRFAPHSYCSHSQSAYVCLLWDSISQQIVLNAGHAARWRQRAARLCCCRPCWVHHQCTAVPPGGGTMHKQSCRLLKASASQEDSLPAMQCWIRKYVPLDPEVV